MAREKLVDRPVEKRVSIPESVCTKVDLQLFSELEGKVPHGEWGRLVTRLLENWLATLPAVK